MYALLTSTGVVAISEVGDKTQSAGVAACFPFPQTPADRAPHFRGDRAEPHRGGSILLDPASEGRCNGNTPSGRRVTDYCLVTGTGMPGILTLTAPRWLRLVK